jgi:hypothetical protein
MSDPQSPVKVTMPSAFRNNLVPTSLQHTSSEPKHLHSPFLPQDQSERHLRLVIATPPSRCCDVHLSPASIFLIHYTVAWPRPA